ncbi:TetR/AcrR family transcriptional regulator [Kineococcus rubinsiae]|uniref:TetR/AcrR family transcriptional regulator n=1 Tax=Kineococcus rubinsiae TaxID=2609562 RepID=UPI001430B0B1|nr:TetR/AcrR family transcriptional regulator [Kineococcus rubinsiae]NIZ92076.1 TetR/AcrR family transcriptional regulator [Kineococcus rubinsiae]
MTPPPFHHHGNLRAVLLDAAERTLREGTVDDLSLRDLARQAGVSHGAPRSHFIDRQALLDALAERGFARLADAVAEAGAAPAGTLVARVHAVATAYVDFAVSDAALMELMFSTKGAGAPPAVQAAAARLFSAFGAMFDADFRAGHFRGTDPERTKLFFVAALQGIAALITSGRVSPGQGGELVEEAVALVLVDGAPGGS